MSDCCFLCGKGGDLARHEIYGGADRQTSKAVGLWVLLCPACHEKAHSQSSWADALKQLGQREFIREHGADDFNALFGRNYL